MASRRLHGLWAGLDRLHGEMERLFDWGGGVELPRPLVLAPKFPPLTIREDADAFYLEAELPGLTQEQVQVSVTTNRSQVTITGERKLDETLKGNWHRRERGFGKFQRTLKLPVAIDADKVEAKLENGVLQLTLPKAEEAKPRRITVKGE